MPPSLPAPTLSDQSGLWACGQREDALPTGPTGAATGDYMIEKCQPCNRSTLSAMYPVEPQVDLSPHAGRGGASGIASVSPTIRREGVVDMGRGDRRLAGGDGDLVELQRDVASRIEVRHVGAHVLVDHQAAGIVGAGAKAERQLGAHFCPHRRLAALEFQRG